jgi:4-hydroxy-tetrahydrodipicolinate synthase
MELSGCGTALVTPFLSDGSLDEKSLTALVEWQIQSGIRFLVACGTTAETPTLNDDEWLRVIRLVAGAAGKRVPVLAGCTHNATREAVDRAVRAAEIEGVDGVLTANPYYNKPTQEGQYRHFRAIAESVSCPVVLYNIPSRTGVNLEPATILRLATDVPNIQAVKESSGNLQQITELIHQAGSGFSVFAGDDGMALPVIALGGAGLVSVASNEIPAEMARMIDSALKNEWQVARDLYRHYAELIAANFWESSPGPVKCVMAMMGLIEENYRLPIVPVTATTRTRLAQLMDKLGLSAPSTQTSAQVNAQTKMTA